MSRSKEHRERYLALREKQHEFEQMVYRRERDLQRDFGMDCKFSDSELWERFIEFLSRA
jgi:hypothetical protein